MMTVTFCFVGVCVCVFHYAGLCDFLSRNTSPQEEDQNSKATTRGSGQICEREQSAQDNCVSSRIVVLPVLRFLPMTFTVCPLFLKLNVVFAPWISTFSMLNSLLNLLIYCWRQKEMRQFASNETTRASHG